MKLAIMQPYIFPYIGYFQLINGVDKFVIYDDVNFIKQGWIHKNNVLVQNKSLSFAIPLVKQSSFLKINEIEINFKIYSNWKTKFLKTLELAYKKAPNYHEIYHLIVDVLAIQESTNISQLATSSIIRVMDYLRINTQIVESSSVYGNSELSGKHRVLNICKIEKATEYINPIGGVQLYDKKEFKEKGISLNFIEAGLVPYKQFKNEFIPALSIIDILMFNSIGDIQLMLNNYKLL